MSVDPEAVRAFEYVGWQRAAAHYGTRFAGASRRFIDSLLDAVEAGAGTRLLDVACGPGYAAAAAAARGANVTGVDFSPAMLALARAEHPQLAFEEGDAERLPFADAGFDAVVSNFGIHHVPRPALALAQAHRVLVPGGRIAFTAWADPDENLAWQIVFEAIARHGDMAAAQAPPPGGKLGSREECARVLEEARFEEVGVVLRRDTWAVESAEDLIECLRQGTARMAALISAQEPSALPAIVAHVAQRVEPYRDGRRLLVPIAAVLASGRKRAA